MSDNQLSPIVIFAYNRPIYLEKTLRALKDNAESADSTLYIYCDGAKLNATETDIKSISEVRALARSEQWCKDVIVVENDRNYGLSESIISGITSILEKHDSIIVLEDDLVTSPYFLRYMNTALNKYNNVDEVISVVGYNYPISYEDNSAETFFLKSTDCLGWATWKRGWNLFERDANILIEKIENSNLTKEFNFDDQYPYMKLLKNVARGTASSWAIRWYASAFVNNKLSLFPNKSLVRHIGNIGTNVKADNSDIFGWEINMQPVEYFEPEIKEDLNKREKLSKHFRKFNRRRLSIHTIKYIYKRLLSV